MLRAADGEEALRKARGHVPDLVVLDLMLPEVDGLEVCKILRRDPATAGIPIITLTASAMADDRAQCLAAGMTDYVAKPVSLEALSAAVARSLGYSCGVSSTTDQPSPGSKLSMAEATSSVSSPRSAS